MLPFLLLSSIFRISWQNECKECCNLIYRTRVYDWPETSRHVWGANLTWYLDDQEVREVLGRIDRYEIRHGKLRCWGGRILEQDAQYVTLPVANTSLILHALPVGYYGVQICTFNDQHVNMEIDWDDAWIGTIGIGNLNGHDKHIIRSADIMHSTCKSNAPSIHTRSFLSVLILCILINQI